MPGRRKKPPGRLAAHARTPVLLALLAASALVSLRVGAHPLAWADILQLWFPRFAADAVTDRGTVVSLLWEIRLPRLLAALGVGAGLSMAGAAYQGLFRNSLVSPDILGSSAGAALGAALGLTLSLPVVGVQTLGFLFGLAAVILTCGLGRAVGGGGHFTLRLVLTGMVVGSLFMAGVSVIKILADPYSKLPAITFWLMGSLAATTRADLALLFPPLALGVTVLLLLRWPLNLMALGEDEARSLGVPVTAVRVLVLVGATLITSATVAVAGIIGWIGLMVPHAARFWVGPNHRDLLPSSLLIGGICLLWADNLARCLFAVEFPLGVVTCACGAPVFLVMLRRSQKTWAE
ncbi:iron ABC transporter permease [Termitidicoccus mucosus]|uniref:FecCD family ABC transporter permease n=1 Tax=Termitidicoccus mucosus TaxID=1184151 RepID=UPI000A0294A2